jgi:hypothetical protein
VRSSQCLQCFLLFDYSLPRSSFCFCAALAWLSTGFLGKALRRWLLFPSLLTRFTSPMSPLVIRKSTSSRCSKRWIDARGRANLAGCY